MGDGAWAPAAQPRACAVHISAAGPGLARKGQSHDLHGLTLSDGAGTGSTSGRALLDHASQGHSGIVAPWASTVALGTLRGTVWEIPDLPDS